MSKKPTVTTIASGFYSTSALNDNFTNIRDQFDNTLSLDGSTPNAMGADLDMNNNDLLNAKGVYSTNLFIGGNAVSLTEFTASNLAVTREFLTITAMLADTGVYTTDYVAGNYFRVVDGNYTYEVAASGASDHHLTTAGGVKLYVLATGGFVTPEQFGATGDGVADDVTAVQAAVDFGANVRLINLYKITDSIKTPATTNYRENSDSPLLIIKGLGQKTGLLRAGASVPNYAATDVGAIARYDAACISVRGSNMLFEDFSLYDSAIGFYMGDDPSRVDVDFDDAGDIPNFYHSSFNRFRNIRVRDVGVAFFAESTHGIYYNTFQDIHATQCQVGFKAQNHHGAAVSGKVNRNTFVNFRADRCVVGGWFEDASTNTLISFHTEGGGTGASGLDVSLASTPTGLPASLTTGGGLVFESTADKNEVFGCQSESNPNDLYNDSATNKFIGNFFDDNSDKVFHTTLPNFYVSRNVAVFGGVSYRSSLDGGDADVNWPDSRKQPGMTYAGGVEHIFASQILASDSGDKGYRLEKTVVNHGGLTTLQTLSIQVGENSSTKAQSQHCVLKIMAYRSNDTALLLELTAFANYDSGRSLRRYNKVSETQTLINAAPGSTSSTILTATLRATANDLFIDVTTSEDVTDVWYTKEWAN